MKAGSVVSDSSPIIAFHAIGRLDVLQAVFGGIVVPPIVAQEVAPSLAELPRWVRVAPESPRVRPGHVRGLDRGEQAAIELALTIGATTLVVDDLAARRWGARLGLQVVGSVGVAVRAKRLGAVASARPLIDALIDHGLFLDRQIYREALTSAKESFEPPHPMLPE